jgi:hypothetical protein
MEKFRLSFPVFHTTRRNLHAKSVEHMKKDRVARSDTVLET